MQANAKVCGRCGATYYVGESDYPQEPKCPRCGGLLKYANLAVPQK